MKIKKEKTTKEEVTEITPHEETKSESSTASPKLLPLELKKNGFLYKQVKRGNKAVIYSAEDEGMIISYETFLIKVSPPKVAFGKNYDAYEMFPGNGVFGLWAWCYSTLEQAEKKFDEIESGVTVENVDSEEEIKEEINA